MSNPATIRRVRCRYPADLEIPGTKCRFGDDRWEFDLQRPGARNSTFILSFELPMGSYGEVTTPPRRSSTVTGPRLTDPEHRLWLVTLKEFAYARLVDGPEKWRDLRCSVATANCDVRSLSFFARFLIIHGVPSFSKAREPHLVDFVRLLGQGKRSPDYVGNLVFRLQLLWECRDWLSYPLAIDPLPLIRRARARRDGGAALVEDWSPRVNATLRIPDPVMRVIGTAALRYVEVYSREILEALRVAGEIRAATAEKYGEMPEARKENAAYACYQPAARRALAERAQSWDTERDAGWTPPSGLLELRTEVSHLRVSCWIVIAWLTAMRPQEIASLRIGCCRIARSRDGLLDRAFIRARRYKGRGAESAGGVEDEWVTVPEVKQAIDILEALVRLDYESAESGYLFPSRGGRRYREPGANAGVVTVDAMGAWLKVFQERVAEPGSEAAAWPLTPRQFRRTAAWWFVRTPFGEVAGKEHFKHASIAVFEGYAGRDPEFRAIVREEELVYNVDLLEEAREEIERGGVVAGPGGAELTAQIRARSGDRHGDDWERWVHHLAQIMYPGPLNLCVFDRAKAVCLQSIPIERRERPILIRCQQDVCRNSSVLMLHLPAWMLQLEEIEKALAERAVAANKRAAYELERVRVLKTIAPLLLPARDRIDARCLCDITDDERRPLEEFRGILQRLIATLEHEDAKI